MAKSVKELNLVVSDLQQKFESELTQFKKALSGAVSPDPLFANGSYEDLVARFSTFERDIMKEVKDLKSAVEIIQERVDKIERQLDRQEQQTYRNNLILHGIKERDNESRGDVFAIIKTLFKDKFDVSDSWLSDHCVLDSYRIGKKRADRSRPIVVSFATRCLRDEIFVNKSKLKGSGVMCTEMLARSRLKIFKKCAAVFKRQCWTSNGVVVVLQDGVKNFITTDQQCDDIIGRRMVAGSSC